MAGPGPHTGLGADTYTRTRCCTCCRSCCTCTCTDHCTTAGTDLPHAGRLPAFVRQRANGLHGPGLRQPGRIGPAALRVLPGTLKVWAAAALSVSLSCGLSCRLHLGRQDSSIWSALSASQAFTSLLRCTRKLSRIKNTFLSASLIKVRKKMRRRAEDHCRDPRAARDQEGSHAPGSAGSGAATRACSRGAPASGLSPPTHTFCAAR